jgi:hypothetical protein
MQHMQNTAIGNEYRSVPIGILVESASLLGKIGAAGALDGTQSPRTSVWGWFWTASD